ncbi:hypothetical protein [Streptomyces sp. RKAG293]|uniref:hypothetical protein n=1 Tax=Streptomyces sp. RKAG293 TaxID=2893403 RepID=UPI0020342160|nr:hypothetical protein [Streptomyces sp. RKAG293]MCM2416634.1 hypothetical protein [Streptomyces sp. RKAG293]
MGRRNAIVRAHDFERLVQRSGSLITWAAITLMTTRRITEHRPRQDRTAAPCPRGTQRD